MKITQFAYPAHIGDNITTIKFRNSSNIAYLDIPDDLVASLDWSQNVKIDENFSVNITGRTSSFLSFPGGLGYEAHHALLPEAISNGLLKLLCLDETNFNLYACYIAEARYPHGALAYSKALRIEQDGNVNTLDIMQPSARRLHNTAAIALTMLEVYSSPLKLNRGYMRDARDDNSLVYIGVSQKGNF